MRWFSYPRIGILNLLFRRKEEYLAKHAQKSSDTSIADTTSAVVMAGKVRNQYQSLALTSVKEIQASQEDSATFRLIARVKDFYPLDIRDFCMKACTGCNKM